MVTVGLLAIDMVSIILRDTGCVAMVGFKPILRL
jgi:hypothetical protein